MVDPRTAATAVVGVLTEVSRVSPVLVAIDDVQWVDLASRRALEFVARRLPASLGLLVTRRSDDAGAAHLISTGAIAAALPSDSDGTTAVLEAEGAGILVSEHGRVRFTHPLLASAVYGSASDTQRRVLHRRLAEVVNDAEERARHLSQMRRRA